MQGALYQAHRKCTIRRNSFFFLPLTTKTGSKREAPKADSSTWLTPQLTVDLGGGYAARCLLFLRCTKRITRFPPQKNPMTHSIKCRHSALTTVNTGHTVAPRVTFPASQLSPDPASPHSDGRWPSQYPVSAVLRMFLSYLCPGPTGPPLPSRDFFGTRESTPGGLRSVPASHSSLLGARQSNNLLRHRA